jgi:hypothetical protein
VGGRLCPVLFTTLAPTPDALVGGVKKDAWIVHQGARA